MTDKFLIFAPNDENYIEILGHRIDGFESFEAFCEHLKKYAELEETVKTQKAEIDKMKAIVEQSDTNCRRVINLIGGYERQVETAKAEAVKEFAERVKDFMDDVPMHSEEDFIYVDYFELRDKINNLVKEMVGEG